MPVGTHRVHHIQFPLTSMGLCLQNVLAVAMSGCKLSPITELEEVIIGWQKSIAMHNNIICAMMSLQRTATRTGHCSVAYITYIEMPEHLKLTLYCNQVAVQSQLGVSCLLKGLQKKPCEEFDARVR